MADPKFPIGSEKPPCVKMSGSESGSDDNTNSSNHSVPNSYEDASDRSDHSDRGVMHTNTCTRQFSQDGILLTLVGTSTVLLVVCMFIYMYYGDISRMTLDTPQERV